MSSPQYPPLFLSPKGSAFPLFVKLHVWSTRALAVCVMSVLALERVLCGIITHEVDFCRYMRLTTRPPRTLAFFPADFFQFMDFFFSNLYLPADGGRKRLSSPHFHVFSYMCINSTQLYSKSSATWRILELPLVREYVDLIAGGRVRWR